MLRQEIELLQQWGTIYDKYISEFCDEEGVQEGNLTKVESMGRWIPYNLSG